MTVFFLRRAAQEKAGDDGLRVGLTVGKVLGESVERNRIRRRMREALRNSLAKYEGPVDVVFNPRKAVLNLSFTDLVDEVSRGLQMAVQRARTAEQK